MAATARVLASVTTGLETIACDELVERVGSAIEGFPSIRPGSFRLSVAREALSRLSALRCAGQLTLLVEEDAAFFSGRKGAVQLDLGRLRELGSAVDWAGGLLLRNLLVGRAQQQQVVLEEKEKEAEEEEAQAQAQALAPVRFRVTCKRTTAVDGRDVGIQHGFSSVQAAAELGGAIAQAMGGRWVVSLKEFDLDITMAIAGRELTLGLKAELAGEGADCRARAGRVGSTAGLMLGRTSLKVALAHAMSRLALGNDAESIVAENNSAGLTLDPMCGSGCIGLESASYWPSIVALGGDVEPKDVRRLGRSLTTLRQSQPAELKPSPPTLQQRTEDDSVMDSLVTESGHVSGSAAAHRCDAVLWDATRLPLRTGVFDSIATDLPWGQTVGTRAGNKTLYPAALKEFGRVLRPGGRCVLMTADRKAMAVALGGCQGEQHHQNEAAWVGACFERRKTVTTVSAAKEDASTHMPIYPAAEPVPQPELEPEYASLVERRVFGGYVIQLRENSSDELVFREIFGNDPTATADAAAVEPTRCYERYGIAPQPGDVWIDAGAHIGLFTFRALALGALHVYCYEPHPENFARLVANIALNGSEVAARVTLINAALEQREDLDRAESHPERTATDDTRPLFLAQRPHRGGETNNYRHSLFAVAPGGSDVKMSSIPVRTVNFAEALRRHPDATAVKMDIEGAELQILSRPQPWGRVRKLCFEYTCKSQRLPAIEENLRHAGFTLFYPKELLFPRGSDGVVFATRSAAAVEAAVVIATTDAEHQKGSDHGKDKDIVTNKPETVVGDAVGGSSGAAASVAADDDGDKDAVAVGHPLESAEPDHLVNVGGRFAGVWVLGRTQTPWEDLNSISIN
jgi:FkbM family methyltransferase